MKPLNSYERKNAILHITPSELSVSQEYKDNMLYKNIVELSKEDFGRGMLESEKFALLESMPFLNELSEQVNLMARVNLTKIDSFILSLTLKAALTSQVEPHKNDITLLIPPMSYAYPLLLAYHLILQHLANNLINGSSSGLKFPQNKGILIITDNFDLLSRVWRTSILQTYLRDFIKTYTIQAGQFKSFSPVNNKKHIAEDGTLPWIALYRAVRKQLPEQLDRQPEVIIIDLLPYRHRKRVESLLQWAKSKSEHVLIIGPLHDEHIYNSIKRNIQNVIALDKFIIHHLNNCFEGTDESNSLNQITSCWGIGGSLEFLSNKQIEFQVLRIRGVEKLVNKILDTFTLLARSLNRDGTQSKAFTRLSNIFIELIGLSVQLDWYERVRMVNNKPKLIDLINSSLKIPGETFEEDKLQKELLEYIGSNIREIYNMLFKMEESPRGQAVISIIKNNINKKILIISANSIVASEIKVWIRAKTGLSAKELSNLTVMSQEVWAKEQLNKIHDEKDKVPEVIVLLNPWKEKYLSSFYFYPQSKIYSTCLSHEIKIVNKQFKKICGANNQYIEDYKKSLSNILNCDYKEVDINNTGFDYKIIVSDFYTQIIEKTDNIHKEQERSNIDMIFNEDIFMSMFNIEEDEDNDTSFNNSEEEQVSIEVLSSDDLVKCTEAKIYNRDKEKSNYFFIPHDGHFKVLRLGTNDIKNLNTLEIQRGDYLIMLRKNEKRELFESILQLSSNTITMKWINLNVAEWREMTRLLWLKYYIKGTTKKLAYNRIYNDIRKNGGNIETTYTIKNWINGDVTSVKSESNVYAVAKIIGEDYYLDRVKVIYKSMKTLWKIHIQLGRSLVKIITQHAGMKKSSSFLLPEWVDLGMDIRIPVQDILNIVELIEIQSVNTNSDIITYEKFTLKPLKDSQVNFLLKKGLIRYE